MRSTSAAAALMLLAATIASGSGHSAAPAAEGQPYDIVAFHADDVRIDSGACRDLRVTAEYANPDEPGHDIDISTEVWRGGKYLDDIWFTEYSVSGDGSTLSMTDEHYWCSWDGLGVFRVGPSEVDAWDADYNQVANFRDDTQATFTVKQASQAALSALRGQRRPAQVTLAATVRMFNVSKSRWKPWADSVASFQRQTSSGWKTVRQATADERGTAVATVRARTARTFRVVVAGDSRTWAAESPAVRIAAP